MGCAASMENGAHGGTPTTPRGGEGVTNVKPSASSMKQKQTTFDSGVAVGEANALGLTFREKSRASMDMARKSLDAGGLGTPTGNASRKSLDSSTRVMQKCESLHDHSSPEEVLGALLAGNERFLNGTPLNPHQDFEHLANLSAGQKPRVAILGCADSRVPPEIAFDQGVGDMFVCRVAGNLATNEEVASLEYAVLELGVKVVMVMGHTKCGAVKAALSGAAFPGFIDTLVDHLDVAISRVDNTLSSEDVAGARAGQQAKLDLVVAENVRYQVERCRRSSIISEAAKAKKLMLVGAVYNLDNGMVSLIKLRPPKPVTAHH